MLDGGLQHVKKMTVARKTFLNLPFADQRIVQVLSTPGLHKEETKEVIQLKRVTL